MAKYRFKTEEEFKADGNWHCGYNTPVGWNNEGEMNLYLGKDVPEEKEFLCDRGVGFKMAGWSFKPYHYKLKNDHPHKFQPLEEKLMEVSLTGEKWVKRVVFGKRNVKNKGMAYYSWCRVEDLEEAEVVRSVIDWKYAREIKEQKTKEQILEEYGLDLNKVEIID